MIVHTRIGRIFKEFIHHFPYSAVGVAACVGLLLAVERMGWKMTPLVFFHVMHPLHVLLSAAVTTAVFWKYEERWLKAGLIGLFGSVVICLLSDVVVPYFGAVLFHTQIPFHLCAVEEPWLIYPSAAMGILAGIFLLRLLERGTEFFHLAHVLVSSLASLLYLVAFDIALWRGETLLAFAITLAAVWVPCCLSDIVFPLAFVKGANSPCCGHHPHEY